MMSKKEKIKAPKASSYKDKGDEKKKEQDIRFATINIGKKRTTTTFFQILAQRLMGIGADGCIITEITNAKRSRRFSPAHH